MTTYYDSWQGPLGEIVLRANDTALTGLFFAGQKYYPSQREAWQHAPRHAVLSHAREQIIAYFAGTLTRFELPIEFDGSAFQQRVWQALARIPYGELVTYGDIAVELGFDRTHARAVGSATGRNPVSIVVPCHRVLAGSGALTGYAGGLERKRALLALEAAGRGRQLSLLAA
jgi:methylated-DNA-[protein]-cysteine S-methyltransferase